MENEMELNAMLEMASGEVHDLLDKVTEATKQIQYLLDKIVRLENDKAELLEALERTKTELRSANDTIFQQEVSLDVMRASLNNMGDIL